MKLFTTLRDRHVLCLSMMQIATPELLCCLPLLICGAVFLHQSEARRVRIDRPLQEEEEEESVNYYAAEPQDEQRRVVLVSSADQYNGLYGQPSASSRSAQDNYIPRGSIKAHDARTKEAAKAPPVQTIRNYNKVNDDGSFTFGYESADGSFKEETRGKYLYEILTFD
ncbi:hypothetical protein NQ318_018144 [Aromia moschata]|uniref:Uncharacterized protein n=1 Tax=Aromia moschata TaxID=1265417 RepID=A0AAV8ZF52_9CUCU|nr:hypothetical protein NQ318_018144 [Aromia moschata]